MNRLLKSLTPVLLLAVLLLAACTTAAPAPTNTSGVETPSVEPEPETSGLTPEDLSELPAGEVLVQMDYEPTFFFPETLYEFGRVPPFTLLAGGRVIYVDEGANFDEQHVMVARLSPEEALDLHNQVRELVLDRLRSYTEFCRPASGENQECVMDASYTILRVLQPSGDLREVKIYASFADDLQALESIRTLLAEYSHPEAVLFVPEQAALFIEAQPERPDMELLEWPLDPAYLVNPTSDQPMWAVVLEGEPLEQYMQAVERNNGSSYFEHEGKYYRGYFVPWMPGADFSAQLQAEFPTPEL